MVDITGGMELALWIVLGSMAANLLVGLYKSLAGGKLSPEPVLGSLRDIVSYVLPLLILSGISAMDETGWIVPLAYYVGAVAVVIKYLMDIRAKWRA